MGLSMAGRRVRRWPRLRGRFGDRRNLALRSQERAAPPCRRFRL